MYSPQQIDQIVQALAVEIGGEGKWLLISHTDHHEIRWLDEAFATEDVRRQAASIINR